MLPPTFELTPEQRAQPQLVFQELFDTIDLATLQEDMWVGLKAMVSGRYKHLSSMDKERQLEVYAWLQKALLAMHLLAGGNK